VAISLNVRPKEYKSARASSGNPRACSGAMYANVPITAPAAVIAVAASPADALDPNFKGFF
jgi:hypothetical protein